MHNLSYEDEFYLHENEKSFSYQRLSTYSRFETEAGGTRKWPILLRVMNIELVFRSYTRALFYVFAKINTKVVSDTEQNLSRISDFYKHCRKAE